MVQQIFRGPIAAKAGLVQATAVYDVPGSDFVFFVASRKYRVVAIRGRVNVAGTDAGGVTCEVRKAPSGTAISSGTLLHSGTFNLKGTVDTNQTLTLSTTVSALDIAVGDCLGFDLTGVATAAKGAITVVLAPK
jgi:hypothetical protein